MFPISLQNPHTSSDTALDTIEKSGDSLNKLLLSLHYESEFLFDGCVRLFTELPRHIQHNVEVRRKIGTYYGGRSKRAGVQHHCFQTDSDGFYSCYRINQEVSVSFIISSISKVL